MCSNELADKKHGPFPNLESIINFLQNEKKTVFIGPESDHALAALVNH